MSKVFNMVGGGSKNISSIVITGLSSTDTVTCTKDGKSYAATWDSTLQHWEIVGLPLGTFTVTATDGTSTVTETVLIDIAGVYEIEISYPLWLYRDGDPCTEATGGWNYPLAVDASQGIGTATSNDQYMQFSAGGGRVTSGMVTKKTIDATGYTKLKVLASSTGSMSDAIYFGFSYGAQHFGYEGRVPDGTYSACPDELTEITYDFSSIPVTLTGRYIGVGAGSNGAAYSLKVYRVWLE